MDRILEGLFSFFVPLFISILYYWYISLPVIVILAIAYTRVQSESVKRVLRIVLAFVLLSIIFTGIYYVNAN